MRVVTYDPFVSADRVRERGAELAETVEEAVADADWVTLHLPSTAETRHIVGASLLAQDAAWRAHRQRGPGRAGRHRARSPSALDSGHVAGAALDVFETEPITESPLFGGSDVVVTPHLGASTAEAQDRAGTIIAEQVVRALTGELCENAVNVPDVERRRPGRARRPTCRWPRSSAASPSRSPTAASSGSRSRARAASGAATRAC